jgi:hypothetical protein
MSSPPNPPRRTEQVFLEPRRSLARTALVGLQATRTVTVVIGREHSNLVDERDSFRFLFSQENICGQEGGEDYGDYAVHGEEGGVEFGEVVGFDEGMFVEQEDGYGDHASDC